jgi:hypothetical protein
MSPIPINSCRMQIINRDDTILLPKNLIVNSGTLYEDFESSTDWTAGGTGASVANDTTNYKTGSQSVALTASDAANATMTKTVNWDLSGNWDRMVFYYRLNNPVAEYAGSIFIQLSNDSSFTNYLRCWHASGEYKRSGWNTMTLHKSHFGVVAAGTFANPIIRVRFVCKGAAGKTPSISFDSLYFGVKSIPAVLLRFDDGNNSQYTIFQNIKSHNFHAQIAVDTHLTDGANYCKSYQLCEMDASGWAMSNHTNSDIDLTTLSEANQETQISGGKTALTGWGLSRCADYLVYPSGKSNADTETACTNLGVKTGQTTNSSQQAVGDVAIGYPFYQMWGMPSNGVTSSMSLATWQAYIDRAIVGGYVMPFHFHDIGGSGQWTAGTFYQAMDYLIAKKDLIYPITIDDFYNLSLGPVRIPRVR